MDHYIKTSIYLYLHNVKFQMLIIEALCRSRHVPVSLPLQSTITTLYEISQWYEERNSRPYPMILAYKQ
jgi:hypothetical protein